jgi:hypothetical protein
MFTTRKKALIFSKYLLELTKKSGEEKMDLIDEIYTASQVYLPSSPDPVPLAPWIKFYSILGLGLTEPVFSPLFFFLQKERRDSLDLNRNIARRQVEELHEFLDVKKMMSGMTGEVQTYLGYVLPKGEVFPEEIVEDTISGYLAYAPSVGDLDPDLGPRSRECQLSVPRSLRKEIKNNPLKWMLAFVDVKEKLPSPAEFWRKEVDQGDENDLSRAYYDRSNNIHIEELAKYCLRFHAELEWGPEDDEKDFRLSLLFEDLLPLEKWWKNIGVMMGRKR